MFAVRDLVALMRTWAPPTPRPLSPLIAGARGQLPFYWAGAGPRDCSGFEVTLADASSWGRLSEGRTSLMAGITSSPMSRIDFMICSCSIPRCIIHLLTYVAHAAAMPGNLPVTVAGRP